MVYIRKYLVLDTFIISPEEFYFEKEKKNFLGEISYQRNDVSST